MQAKGKKAGLTDSLKIVIKGNDACKWDLDFLSG